MDKKQTKIFNDILDKFKLKHQNISFIQHRNLKEFKYFNIEKVNPTHRIILYGSLKNNNKKKETTKSLLKVGEIIIGMFTFFININIVIQYINLITLLISIYSISGLFFVLFGELTLKEVFLFHQIKLFVKNVKQINI